jgi:AcrR family transcriptional regulator
MTPPAPRKRRTAPAGEETRSRILAAARDVAAELGFDGFTVDRVADAAGVSRMTVYYQFGSKRELLDAMFDRLAADGRIERLGEAFRAEDPVAGLRLFVETFAGFWASNRNTIRRFRGWANLDMSKKVGGHERDLWRREGLVEMVGRIGAVRDLSHVGNLDGVIDVLNTITGFDAYDVLATEDRDEAAVAALVYASALRLLGIDGP